MYSVTECLDFRCSQIDAVISSSPVSRGPFFASRSSGTRFEFQSYWQHKFREKVAEGRENTIFELYS